MHLHQTRWPAITCCRKSRNPWNLFQKLPYSPYKQYIFTVPQETQTGNWKSGCLQQPPAILAATRWHNQKKLCTTLQLSVIQIYEQYKHLQFSLSLPLHYSKVYVPIAMGSSRGPKSALSATRNTARHTSQLLWFQKCLASIQQEQTHLQSTLPGVVHNISCLITRFILLFRVKKKKKYIYSCTQMKHMHVPL